MLIEIPAAIATAAQAAVGSVRWRWIAAAVLAVSAAAVYGWQEARVLRAERAEQAALAESLRVQVAAGERLVQAYVKARDTEQKFAALRRAAEDAYAQALQARVERDRLLLSSRLRFGPDAAARLGVPATAAAPGGADAATLGQLLAEADRLAEHLAVAADRHADEVRLLLAAWPVAGRDSAQPVFAPTTTE